jgi:hypothetical protein
MLEPAGNEFDQAVDTPADRKIRNIARSPARVDQNEFVRGWGMKRDSLVVTIIGWLAAAREQA